jgi:serine/threonine protein kinase
MSNDRPPRACLADFGFMSMVLDPQKPLSCSAGMDGGTVTFMPPETLAPSVYDVTNPTPTPEGDIYAFGLVILQVSYKHSTASVCLFAHIVQVLTGKIPFHGVRITELPINVINGRRPGKPADASDIGFSDSLWSFTQRCWDGNMNSRPKVAEVVTHLAKAAASWHKPMPPCSQTEDAACVAEEPMSDSMRFGTFVNLSPPLVLLIE